MGARLGALGEISFTLVRRVGRNTRFDMFDSLLRIEVSHVCTGSHSFAMFAQKMTGVQGMLMTLYRILCYLDACLHCMALLCIQLNYVVVSA